MVFWFPMSSNEVTTADSEEDIEIAVESKQSIQGDPSGEALYFVDINLTVMMIVSNLEAYIRSV